MEVIISERVAQLNESSARATSGVQNSFILHDMSSRVDLSTVIALWMKLAVNFVFVPMIRTTLLLSKTLRPRICHH